MQTTEYVKLCYAYIILLFLMDDLHHCAGATVPSDITVEVSGVTFALHKFLLASRCGFLKMLVAEDKQCRLRLEGVPGGAAGFELAAKFCYGTCPEISPFNIALLRCVAEFLDMSEDHGEGNLVHQTEIYLENLEMQTLRDVVTILKTTEDLYPWAEDLHIVSRCIYCIATKAMKSFCDDYVNASIDWFLKDLSVLHVSIFQQVLAAMRDMGLSSEVIVRALIFFAHQSLKGLTIEKTTRWEVDTAIGRVYDNRITVETIVCLLPKEKYAVPISFSIGLLRIAYLLETTVACKLELERCVGMQLHRATLDDILIPSIDGNTSFDVDIMQRLVAAFLDYYSEDDYASESDDDLGYFCFPLKSPMLKVAKLLDSYLAKIALDDNMSFCKFITLAGMLPDHARHVEDGLYRAVDCFLKAHPDLTELEKQQLCRLVNFQRLTQETTTHAAQNERLPVQTVVQVLYFEQLRIRNLITGTCNHGNINSNYNLKEHNHSEERAGTSGSGCSSLSTNSVHYASVRRENQELKLEVARMRMRLSDLEKEHFHLKHDIPKSQLSSHHGFFHAFSKSICKLNPFSNHKPNHFSNHREHEGLLS